MSAQTRTQTNGTSPAKPKQVRVRQSDVPRHTIDEALRVARALADQYGKQPTRPLEVAQAMGMAPTTGKFETLTGASIAYGFTEGGSKADLISLTELGRRVLVPQAEGDDLAAKREALLLPRVCREFLQKYDGSPVPRGDIGRNVLEGMGVPAPATDRTQKLITESAETLGLITDINGRKYVNLQPSGAPIPTLDAEPGESYGVGGAGDEDVDDIVPPTQPADEPPPTTHTTPVEIPQDNRKVFISHGKDRKIVGQLKELLTFGDFEPVVSVERETASKPVPAKVMDDMRACGAGIIHVGPERKLTDEDGNERQMLNENVLIEIGAAMALYGKRFILLVEKGTTLPSNLQGLYRVEYEGQVLDGDATLKLLKAFNDFKS
jgi:predicted nucleotide-binding protein